MTVLALSHFAFIDRVQRHARVAVVHFARFGVVVRGVAVDAVEIGAVGAHVDVVLARGGQHIGRQVTVLDVVAAAGVGMAADAILAGRLGAERNAARHDVEVDRRVGHAGRGQALLIGAGLIVAGQAVYVRRVIEIIPGIGVSVAGVTLGATPLVGRYGDAEVVEQVVLAVRLTLEADHPIGCALPLEVTHVQRHPAFFFVTHQAGTGPFVKDGAEVQLVDIHIVDRRVFEKVLLGDQWGCPITGSCLGPGQADQR